MTDTETNMLHMDHLEQLAAADVLALRDKERTYQGSWKAAGGRSAWFMLRRKMDRLISMLRRPDPPARFDLRHAAAGINCAVADVKLSEAQVEALAHITDAYCAEDIFQLVENNPTGVDGTVLAEVRDLRRYLLLVEAEMVARGVVARTGANPLGSPPEASPNIDLLREVTRRATGVARGEEPRPAPAVDGERLVPRYATPAAAPAFGVPGTPEDGGQHSRHRLEDGQTTNPGVPYFHVVDPISREIYWNVWRPDCERDEVAHLPRLRLELNNHEWKELVAEYRGMYDWHEGDAKWRVKKPYQEAWCEDFGAA